MEGPENTHNYLIIGIAALLALLLLGPYLGFHLFSTEPAVKLPAVHRRTPQIRATTRLPKQSKPVISRREKAKPTRKVQSEPVHSGESLSDIENLLK